MIKIASYCKSVRGMAEVPFGHEQRPAPTPKEYLNGLRRTALNETRRKMLAENLRAPNHAISASEMAKRVFDSPRHDIANIRYGELASTLARKMRMSIPAEHFAITFLAQIETRPNGELEWVLHPSLAQALRLYRIE